MPYLIPILFALLGAVLASFAGVISERLNTGDPWLSSRSRCNTCARTLSAFDLVPVLSWLISYGQCRTCKAPVPMRYPLTEMLMAGLFVLAYYRLGLTPALGFFLAGLFTLAVIVLYDLRHTIVPFVPALILVLISGLYVASLGLALPDLTVLLLVAGGIGLGFFLMHVLSRGTWMGLGDAPIALALSLFAGSQAVSGLLFSFWSGAIVGIIILARTPRGHRMGIEVPFIPFLAFGYLLAFFTQWTPFTF